MHVHTIWIVTRAEKNTSGNIDDRLLSAIINLLLGSVCKFLTNSVAYMEYPGISSLRNVECLNNAAGSGGKPE